jgi:hypothetical protein
MNPRRDILVLLRHEFLSPQEYEHEVECINSLLCRVETWQQFCISFELVNRNRITSRVKKLWSVFNKKELKPFRFLICKN